MYRKIYSLPNRLNFLIITFLIYFIKVIFLYTSDILLRNDNFIVACIGKNILLVTRYTDVPTLIIELVLI